MNEESKREETSTGAAEQTTVTFTPEEQYAQVTMSLIVDNVCLHAAKMTAVQKHYDAAYKVLKETGKD